MRQAALVALVCATLPAQSFDPPQPPAASALRPWKPPQAFETRLPNGLDVVLIDDARIPLVSARLVFACGSRRDPKDLPGLAAAFADLLTHGTTKRSAIEIVEGIDGLGGKIGATAGADSLAIAGSIDASNAAALIDLMADLARNAEFRETDLRIYRQSRRQALAQQRLQPSFAAGEQLRAALFGDHPYARISPSLASVESLDRKALIEFRDNWLVPNNAVLMLTGKLPARAETLKFITASFGSWQLKVLPELKRTSLPTPGRKLILVDRPAQATVEISMGNIGVTQRDAMFFPLVLAALIAGSGSAEYAAYDEAGVVSIPIHGDLDKAAEALQAALGRMDRMGTEPVSESELTEAKAQAAGRFLFGLETQAGLLEELTAEKIRKLPADYLETWRAHLEAVRAEDVRAAAQRYLTAQGMVVVVVGDASRLGPALSKIGNFETVTLK